ncbi:MAG: DUF1987 family protein [Flavobacteriales bacterium]|nr:DUF1987 family protein [Flavobacteriales bacterium]
MFFHEIFDWLKAYAKKPAKKMTLNIRIYYLSSASAKYFLTLLEFLNDLSCIQQP